MAALIDDEVADLRLPRRNAAVICQDGKDMQRKKHSQIRQGVFVRQTRGKERKNEANANGNRWCPSIKITTSRVVVLVGCLRRR